MSRLTPSMMDALDPNSGVSRFAGYAVRVALGPDVKASTRRALIQRGYAFEADAGVYRLTRKGRAASLFLHRVRTDLGRAVELYGFPEDDQ